MSWYRRYRARRAAPKPSFQTNYRLTRSETYDIAAQSFGVFGRRASHRQLNQAVSDQRKLNSESGFVSFESRRPWNLRSASKAQQYTDLLEKGDKTDAYYVRGRGYMAIDQDVAAEIDSKDLSSLEIKLKYGAGAAAWFDAREQYNKGKALAEQKGARYLKRWMASRYSPIDNGDGEWVIGGTAPATTTPEATTPQAAETTTPASVIEPVNHDLKVLSRNSFQAEDGKTITLNETRVSSYWGRGSRKGSFSQDTLVDVEKQTGIGGVSWKILTSRGSGKSKTFYEFDVSDDGIVYQTNLRSRKRALTSALEKEWSLDLDGSGEIGDAVITKIQAGNRYRYENIHTKEDLIEGFAIKQSRTDTFIDKYEYVYSDGRFLSKDLTSSELVRSREGHKQMTLTNGSRPNPYIYGQPSSLTYLGDLADKSDVNAKGWSYYRSYGRSSSTANGLNKRAYTLTGDNDFNVTVKTDNRYGLYGGYSTATGLAGTWVVGDKGDQTLNINADADGTSGSPWYRRSSRATATGLNQARVAFGEGDDTLNISADAEIYQPYRGLRGITSAMGVVNSDISMGSGDDVLNVKSRANATSYEVGARYSLIDMGDGNDKATFDTLTGQALEKTTIDMGAGDDVLTLGGRFDKLSAGNTIKGGDGFDTIIFNNLSETDFNALSRQSFSFTPDKVTLGSTTFEGFEQVQIGDTISFKPSEITNPTQFTDIIKPEVFV